MTLRVIFAGTPQFAVPGLEALLDHDRVDVINVYTQPDRPAGRSRTITAGAVKECAQQHSISVHQPEDLKNEETLARLEQARPDLLVVIAYGLILPHRMLDVPVLGCVNVHASLLPRWRGAAPIQRAIEQGDAQTGVSLMQMTVGLDSGPVLDQQAIPILDMDTGGTLHDQLSHLGAEVLARNIQRIGDRKIHPVAQAEDQATYAHKLEKAESLIDWTCSAVTIERKVRAFNPWPVASTNYHGQMLRIHRVRVADDALAGSPGEIVAVDGDAVHVQTGSGVVALEVLQRPGGRRLAAREFLNGMPLPVGGYLS